MRLSLTFIFKFTFFETTVDFKDEGVTVINKNGIDKTVIWRM
jgi:hypothetical protein